MGVYVSDRFRDLEGPVAVRKKDVVLMATVSSFEGMTYPSKSQLRQFAELFTPLFQASSDEAKRQAVAALSQCSVVPPAVALFIGSQPIDIAAPFLVSSQAIDDDTLITIARTQGAAHARAIVRRDSLSPKVIDALVGIRQTERRRETRDDLIDVERSLVPAEAAISPNAADDEEAGRLAAEEALRLRIKQLAVNFTQKEDSRLGLRNLSALQEALLVRFARQRDSHQFATALADALSASRWLAERIMLDISGQQLATTLMSLGMNFLEAASVLERLYPHLSEMRGEVSRAWMLLDSLDTAECDRKVDAWCRADSYTYQPTEEAKPAPADALRFARQVPPARDMRVVARAFGRSR